MKQLRDDSDGTLVKIKWDDGSIAWSACLHTDDVIVISCRKNGKTSYCHGYYPTSEGRLLSVARAEACYNSTL